MCPGAEMEATSHQPNLDDSDTTKAAVTVKVHPPSPPPTTSPPSMPTPKHAAARIQTGEPLEANRLHPHSTPVANRRQSRKRKRPVYDDGCRGGSNVLAQRLAIDPYANIALQDCYGYDFFADTLELLPDMYELYRAWTRLGRMVGVDLGPMPLAQKEAELNRCFEDRLTWFLTECSRGCADGSWILSGEEMRKIAWVWGSVKFAIGALCEVMSER